jgi:hypothetical protein
VQRNDGIDFVFATTAWTSYTGTPVWTSVLRAKADCVFGDADLDFCVGNEGNDIIEAEAAGLLLRPEGNDEIHGGVGNDFLSQRRR